MLERDRWRCHYCGKQLRPGSLDATVDHLKPVALGGSHDPSNLVAACRSDNAHLGALLGNERKAAQRLGPGSEQWGSRSAPMPQSQAW